MTGYLKITLKRGLAGRPEKQRRIVRGLGLRKTNSTVIRPNRPEIRGMVAKVLHLVEWEEVEGPEDAAGGSESDEAASA